MTSNAQVHRMIEKRRSSIVNKMNAFIAEEKPNHGSQGEYVLWMTAYCQIICYLIDNVFDGSDEKLAEIITILKAYHREAKEAKNERKV